MINLFHKVNVHKPRETTIIRTNAKQTKSKGRTKTLARTKNPKTHRQPPTP